MKKDGFLWDNFYKNFNTSIKVPELSLYEYLVNETKELEYNDSMVYFGRRINYKVFLEYVDRCAKSLKKLGVRKNDVVTVCLPNTPEVAISFLAINKIGAICNMVHPLSAEEEIKCYLNSTKSNLFICYSGIYNKVKKIIKDTLVKKVVFSSPSDSMPIFLNGLYNLTRGRKEEKPQKDNLYIFWKEFLHLGDYYEKDTLEKRKSSDPAVILHSGGTTGMPKSILLPNRSFTVMNEQSKINFHLLEPGDSVLSILPFFHCFGLIVCLYVPLCLGVTCILIPEFNQKTFHQILSKYKPVVLTGVPTLYEAMLKNENMNNVSLSQVKYVISGGDSVPKERNLKINDFLLKHGCKQELQQGYGMTETSGPVTFGSLGSNKLGSVGAPMVGNVVRILDPNTKKELKPNEVGEICVSSLVNMSGYYNNPVETKKALELYKDGRYYVHTGDLGYLDEDGVLFFSSRMKRIIVTSGYNVYPNYVEDILRENKYVKDACVVGIPHPYKVEVVKAFIILKDDIKESYTVKRSIMEHAEKHLAKYMVPKEYIFKDEFPKTKYLKTDYNKLKEELLKK